MSDRSKRKLKLNVARRQEVINNIITLLDLSKAVKSDVYDDNFKLFVARVISVEETFQKFLTIHDDVKELYLEDNQEAPTTEAGVVADVESKYYQILSLANDLNLKTNPNKIPKEESVTMSSRLAPIKLPTFSGSLEEFSKFQDLFESLINKNNSLSAIEKYHYFVSSLFGQALNLIKGIPFDSSHCNIAYNTFMNHYRNDRLLAFRYLDNIVNHKPVKSDDTKGLESFIYSFNENITALKGLKIQDLSEFILFYLATRVIDSNTLQQFELDKRDVKFPTANSLIKFGLQYVNILKFCHTKSNFKPKQGRMSPVLRTSHAVSTANKELSCYYCHGKHAISNCQKFYDLIVDKRIDFVKENKLCFTCLGKAHFSDKCKSNRKCSCNSKHNPLLCHNKSKVNTDCDNTPKNYNNEVEGSYSGMSRHSDQSTVFGTCIVYVKDKFGNLIKARALIDNGSMPSFVTTSLFKKLGVHRRLCHSPLFGVGGTPLKTDNYATTIKLYSLTNPKVEYITDVIITPKVTSILPPRKLPASVKQQFDYLDLGDRLFDVPDQIDILIGANLYPDIIILKGTTVRKGSVIAYPTVFGYVVTGRVPTEGNCNDGLQCGLSVIDSDKDLNKLVSQFWHYESVPNRNIASKDDELAEAQYKELYYRSPDGRYNSPLLCRPNIDELGESFNNAKSRLLKLERTLSKFPALRGDYNAFMKEYIDLGHMHKVELGTGRYYVPHHAVYKDSSTTKCRVVFDASSVTSSGLSLNDCLYKGPVLYQNLFDILMRFRFHRIAFVGDIAKMYRMVNIIPDHRKYQHILFRFDPSDPISDWELDTDTYGFRSAGFIACRAIVQNIRDEGDKYPHALSIAPRDFYVDDLLSGASDVKAAQALISDLSNMLRAGGFLLRKWLSNEPEALGSLPDELKESHLRLDPNDEGIKVLGIHWNSNDDHFSFHISPCRTKRVVTKRSVLSVTARVFDPMGYVAPVIFYMKSFFQNLWKLNYGWDDPLEDDILDKWLHCVENLPSLHNVKIPRFVGVDGPSAQCINLLGFSDASELGYSAVVYARVGPVDQPGEVFLLAAKTRLAPVKTLTIPRLELLGAQLLKDLLVCVHSALNPLNNIINVYAWTDSTIVLSWLDTPPCNLKIFVAHRVVDINDTSIPIKFCHINSADNPADVACRGLLPDQIADHRLWWKGPDWCSEAITDWRISEFDEVPWNELPEVKTPVVQVNTVQWPEDDPFFILTEKISNFSKLRRITAYVLRYMNNCYVKAIQKDKIKSPTRTGPHEIRSGILSSLELNSALETCIFAVQKHHFSNDFKLLRDSKGCSKSIRMLCPFIGDKNILRAGGRLKHANIPEHSKEQYLLPKHSAFTHLIIDHYHVMYLHVGPNTLMSLLRRRFWILSARSVIRQRIHKCVVCTRFRAVPIQPLMGQIPSPRVVQSRVFSHVGVDYAGPFSLKEHKRSGAKIIKAYVVVFVCFCVKAVHLEIVTELSTLAFLDAFDRFCARRGFPSDVYSDCGTNFKGASRYFKDLIKDKDVSSEVGSSLASRGVNWHFNSPGAASMGDLWEAAVKSTKNHMYKTIGCRSLTYEELNTLMLRIEAIINSRPLTPLSTSPSEADVLTPGHFLVGGPLVSPPEPNLLDIKEGVLNRWQLIRNLTQHFWNRWSADYLNSIQQRSKWYNEVPNLTRGAVVLIKSENTSPTKWPLGIVEELFPGPDSIVRVVELRVGDKKVRRPVNKLISLSVDN